MLHAPVDEPSIGLKHGVHFSLASQVSCGSIAAWPATSGSTCERQRPSAPLIEVHVFAVNLPPVRRNTSGTHSLLASAHDPSCAACAGSLMKLASTQCASAPHASSDVGSSTDGQPSS